MRFEEIIEIINLLVFTYQFGHDEDCERPPMIDDNDDEENYEAEYISHANREKIIQARTTVDLIDTEYRTRVPFSLASYCGRINIFTSRDNMRCNFIAEMAEYEKYSHSHSHSYDYDTQFKCTYCNDLSNILFSLNLDELSKLIENNFNQIITLELLANIVNIRSKYDLLIICKKIAIASGLSIFDNTKISTSTQTPNTNDLFVSNVSESQEQFQSFIQVLKQIFGVYPVLKTDTYTKNTYRVQNHKFINFIIYIDY
jgi:hypothetical protein